jgi:hypothetical protein
MALHNSGGKIGSGKIPGALPRLPQSELDLQGAHHKTQDK